MRLQLHGHLRIEPRWLPLPAPLRDVYNQKPPPSAPTGDELVPRFVGFEGVNAACIFTTPPVRLLPLTSESRVFAHAAEGDGTMLICSVRTLGCSRNSAKAELLCIAVIISADEVAQRTLDEVAPSASTASLAR